MKKRSAKRRPTKTPGQAEKHRAGVEGMLKMAGRLNGLAEKVTGKPDWKSFFMAADAVADKGSLELRLLQGFLTYLKTEHDMDETCWYEVQSKDGQTVRTSFIVVKTLMILTAVDVAAGREEADPKALRLKKKANKIAALYGKKSIDEAWPKDEDVPDDVVASSYFVWVRRAELTAAILQEIGEDRLAADILAEPVSFWGWWIAVKRQGDQTFPKGLTEKDAADEDRKTLLKLWSDYFPKAKTTGS